MAVEREPVIYFKKTVPYIVGVRFFPGDNDGKALTQSDPYVWINEGDLRDFKRANRIAIAEGLIARTTEPIEDEDNPNALSEETVEAAVKNTKALKDILDKVTAEAPVVQLLEEARLQRRPKATITLLEKKLRELSGELPEDMEGAI